MKTTNLNKCKYLTLSKLFIMAMMLIYSLTSAMAQVNCSWAFNPMDVLASGGNIQTKSMAVDQNGNVFVTGYFENVADFDFGAGTAPLISMGSTDCFFAKYDAAGNYVFAKNLGGTSNDYAFSVTVDVLGNFYITGNFWGTVDFDPGSGVTNLTSNGTGDVFFAKYDAEGKFVFAKQMGGTLDEMGMSITVDLFYNIYIAGTFQGTADFDPGAGIANLNSSGSEDVFIAKYDLNGNYIYAKKIGGGSSDIVLGNAVDPAGYITITGYYAGTADFDPGAGTANLSSSGLTDCFFAKYDPAGNYVFAKSLGGTSHDYSFSIALDASSNIYLVGNFWSTVDFDPGTGTANLSSSGIGDCFFAKYDASGNYIFAKKTSGPLDEIGTSIKIDNANNIYLGGYFQNTADFDPGVGVANLTSTGNMDVFIAKYNANGDFINAKSFGGASDDVGYSISIDAAGNTFVSGYFSGTADFDPGAGTATLVSGTGFTNGFIGKYDGSGNYLWAGVLGRNNSNSAFPQRGNSIKTDNAGNIYVTGFYRALVDFDPGPGLAELYAPSGQDIFFAKYNTLGNCIFAKSIGGSSDEDPRCINIDASGNIYITGIFQGTADFDPGAGVYNLTSAGSNDIFLAKYDPIGNLIFAKNMGGSSSDVGYSVAVDAAGYIYLTGYYEGTADFDPGAGTAYLSSSGLTDCFFAKYDPSGNFVFVKKIGGPSHDYSLSLALDASNNIYLTGNFWNTVDFDPGPGTSNLSSAGIGDCFIAKYDASGNYIYAKKIFGTSDEVGTSIFVDGSDNIYVSGYFQGTTDFGLGTGIWNLSSSGSFDIFIAKYLSGGNLVYAQRIGGAGEDVLNSSGIDANGNTYITGYFAGTSDFDPGPGIANITSHGSYDIFIGKYDPLGNYLYATAMGGPDMDFGQSVSADAYGNA
ncbi:MAG TPA: SBBP repeat-containing protein [Bacteroidales bacterium]|nr:SBBP repeat-containing protein [Bacteroidales bacterium]